MNDPVCDRCGRLWSHHAPPKMTCPFVSTFRADRPVELTHEAVTMVDSIRTRLGIGLAVDFDAWLTRALERLTEMENDGEEWKR
jgi:hypothetical protein